jgi:hypothetical protein
MATQTSPPKTEASEKDSSQLAERTVHRRAVEAVVWGLPAVNFDRLYQGIVQCKGAYNQIVYWSRLFDWKNQTLTPNPGTVYLMPFYNTRDVGPMVLEIPPAESGSITGSVDDGWQTAIEDVGPAGVDKGKGGKYLILPPGYKDAVGAEYIRMPSETYAGFASGCVLAELLLPAVEHGWLRFRLVTQVRDRHSFHQMPLENGDLRFGRVVLRLLLHVFASLS